MEEANKENWVVMPCFNEEANISDSIDDVHKFCKNLIIVDDGSKDSTFKIAESKNTYNLKHAINLGKGAALKTGTEYAIKNGAKKIVFIDSDGQHEGREIPKFFSLLDDHDIIFGSRRLNNSMPLIFRIGNLFLTNFIYLLFGVKISDTQSGYRGIRANVYQKLEWKATDYSVESEMIANAGKNRLSYKETEINTIYKDRYKGTTVFDGIKIAFYMILFRLQR